MMMIIIFLFYLFILCIIRIIVIIIVIIIMFRIEPLSLAINTFAEVIAKFKLGYVPLFCRYAVDDECHLYKSTTMTADTCELIGGLYVTANRTCYYHSYSCPYYTFGGQCHRYRSCGQYSCETCRVFGGHYVVSTGWYVTCETRRFLLRFTIK